MVAETALPGRPGEPMLALLTWRLQPVHDGVGGGGDLLLEQVVAAGVGVEPAGTVAG